MPGGVHGVHMRRAGAGVAGGFLLRCTLGWPVGFGGGGPPGRT